MPDDTKNPRTYLPDDTPKDLRDFVRCDRDWVDIESGEIDWVPNLGTLTLGFEPGPDGSITISVFGQTIPISIVNGQLVADTSNLFMFEKEIQEWVADFNADLRTCGRQLSDISIRAGTLHITKQKITAATAGTAAGVAVVASAEEVAIPETPPTPPPHSRDRSDT